MGTEKSINHKKPQYTQIDLPREFGAKGMKVRMCTVTFHKSNNNTLDLSGTFHSEKVDPRVIYGLWKYKYVYLGHFSH